jgi:hypothetical protein
MSVVTAVVLAVVAAWPGVSQTDARELILRSAARDAGDLEARRNYTWLETIRRKNFEGGKELMTSRFPTAACTGACWRRTASR